MFLDRIPVRLRLAVGHAIWMSLLFAGVGLGIHRLVKDHLNDSLEASLLGSAVAIRDARNAGGYEAPLIDTVLERFLGDRFLRPYAQLVDFQGSILSATRNTHIRLPVTPKAVGRAERGLHTFEVFRTRSHARLKQVTVPVIRAGRFTGELIQVGAPMDAIQDTLKGITVILGTALPAGLVMALLIGYFLTSRAFKPVVELQRSASKITIEDLKGRLKLPRARDELYDLASSYNGMLSRMEDAVNRLRRFAGDVSHELRTPIAVIRAEAELAARRKREPEEYQAALARIQKEASDMTHIVEDLLLLAKAESQSVAMNWQDLPLEPLMSQIESSVAMEFQSRNVSLNMQYSKNLKISCSQTYLALALKNLLSNAAKHSTPGQVVDFKVQKKRSALEFRVKDRGDGIAPKDLEHIFDAFYRADTARNRSTGGVGIGLSLAKALVTSHGGQVEVSSELGKGTEFVVSIPQTKGCGDHVTVPDKPAQDSPASCEDSSTSAFSPAKA